MSEANLRADDGVKLVSGAFCSAHHVRPLSVENGCLVLATTKPEDDWIRERLEATTLLELTPRAMDQAAIDALAVPEELSDVEMGIEADHALCELVRSVPVRRVGGEVEIATPEAWAPVARRSLTAALGWNVRIVPASPASVAQALQRRAKRSDGSSERDALEALARALRVPVADFGPNVEPKSLDREDAVILEEGSHSVVVATVDPTSRPLAEDVRKKTGKQPFLLLASPRAITFALRRTKPA